MCTDTYGVRDFHVPSFREGQKEEYEFKNGYQFERFMYNIDSSLDSLQDYKYRSFRDELKRAIKESIKKGLTYDGLISQGKKPFSCYLFEEIKNELVSKDRSKVQMYITLGTPLDLIHGVDMVVFMSGRFVTIDSTIDPFNKDRNKPKFKDYNSHLVFSHYNISQKETNKFAKKVVRLLTRKEV